jgi:transposase-like protein
MQNLHQQVPPPAWPEFKALVAARRAAPTGPEAQRRRQLSVTRSQRDLPQACRGLLADGAARLTPLYLPHRHQHYGRTANLAERALEEKRRRPKVISHLWGEGRVVKLVFAVLLRVSDRWGKQCFREFAQPQLRHLRRRRTLDEQDVSMAELTPESPSRRSAASAA